MTDLVGFAALGLALVAMMSKRITMLRWLHLLSCVLYALYGWRSGSSPVTVGAALFGSIHIVHLYRLRKEARADKGASA